MLMLDKKDFFNWPDDSVSIQPWWVKKRYPEHQHNYNEIVMIEAGSGMHVVNDVAYYVSPGSLFYIEAHDHHLFENMQDFRAINLLYLPAAQMRSLKASDTSLLAVDPTAVAWQLPAFLQTRLRLAMLGFNRHQSAPGNADDRRFCQQENFLLEMLTLLATWRSKTTGFVSAEDKICQSMRWLQGNWREKIDWSEQARRVDLTLRTFQRQFKRYTGLAPQQYLIRLRLTQARYAMETTQGSLSDIAGQCGFYDISHFIWCFKRHFHTAPGALRAQAAAD